MIMPYVRNFNLEGSKLGFVDFFIISIKTMFFIKIYRVPSYPTLEIRDFGRIGEQVLGAYDQVLSSK
jgi:hypothetical protein